LAIGDPESLVALGQLAHARGTTAAVISGRSYADLAGLCIADPAVVLVGSHGAEFGAAGPALTFDQRDRLAAIGVEIGAMVAGVEGVLVERKPASIAVHYRAVAPSIAKPLRQWLIDKVDAFSGVRLLEGLAVIEVLVTTTTKGDALEQFRSAVGRSAAIYIGDDNTDEHAFATLTPVDVGIKVGPGATLARFRVADPSQVRQVLTWLAQRRG